MKVIFMGTPDFAVETLESIIEAGHEISCVVTQPDKPKGRGKAMQYPPVKECALAHGLEVWQPVRIKEEAAMEKLFGYEADVIVVVAFGQILPKKILDWPRFGCINVHASLLPKYRGAAPIQWAVIDGEEQSGVTIMKMDAGIDTGDMIAKTVITLDKDETGGTLFHKLAKEGAKLCVETLDAIENGTAAYEKQDDSQSSHAKMLTKQLGNIDWSQGAVQIERLIRGLNPWPSAFSYIGGKTMKIWKARVGKTVAGAEIGSVALVNDKELAVQTGEGSLYLEEVQLEGKKRMQTADFLRGCRIEKGMHFTQEK